MVMCMYYVMHMISEKEFTIWKQKQNRIEKIKANKHYV